MTELAVTVAALRTPHELIELLDPDVMWYSTDVNSNYTCNGKDDATACIDRALARGLSGRFEVIGEQDDTVIVRPVLDSPAPERELCLLLRFRDGLIVEMRDFASTAAARSYAGIA
jgi:ketosteroid isomerase-like protein